MLKQRKNRLALKTNLAKAKAQEEALGNNEEKEDSGADQDTDKEEEGQKRTSEWVSNLANLTPQRKFESRS